MDTHKHAAHLLYSSDRENLAVEQMLRTLPQFCPTWYDSIDLDPNCHWAIARVVLSTPMLREPQAEIDVILGRMACISDSSGVIKPIWPPPTDYLVAIEAKCLQRTLDDIESSPVSPKSNLTQQLKRNIKLGFSRVGALHVIATTPDEGSYGGAMDAASKIGNHFLLEAERQADKDVEGLPVGHSVLSIGEVSWKPSDQAGAVLLLKMTNAPQIGLAAPVIRDQVDSLLSKLAGVEARR